MCVEEMNQCIRNVWREEVVDVMGNVGVGTSGGTAYGSIVNRVDSWLEDA
jgi:hypothetical protein